MLTSGGVLFSDEVKQGLLRHVPGLLIADVYGSSEAIAAARSVSRSGAAGMPARSFTGGGLTVLGDDDTPVVPGSGEIGRVAYAGLPAGRLLQGRGQVGRDLPDRARPPVRDHR